MSISLWVGVGGGLASAGAGCVVLAEFAHLGEGASAQNLRAAEHALEFRHGDRGLPEIVTTLLDDVRGAEVSRRGLTQAVDDSGPVECVGVLAHDSSVTGPRRNCNPLLAVLPPLQIPPARHQGTRRAQ